MSQHESSSHPVVKTTVVIGGAVLAVFVVMSLVSALIGAAWTIIEIVLAVGVASGLWHMARRQHQMATQGKRDELAHHGGVWRGAPPQSLCPGDGRAELVAEAVIAYGPLWGIGAGQAVTPDDTEEMYSMIRAELGQLAGANAAAMVHIQYGGSVTAEISEPLLGAKTVDGFLLGGASFDAAQFAAIVIGWAGPRR